MRLKYRLGLGVPVEWRPWAAADILSDDWRVRTERRLGWQPTWFLASVGFTVVEVGSIYYLFHLVPVVVAAIGSFTGTSLGRWLRGAPNIEELRRTTLHANGLCPDGSLDPRPSRWSCVAAARRWMADVVLALLAALALAAVGLPVLAVARLVG